MDWSLIITFSIMAAVVTISPGPNFLLITRSVTTVGKTVALANIPGFGVALMLHGTLSIYGVSALLEAELALSLIVQMVGACYLLYLGINSLIASSVSNTGRLLPDAAEALQPRYAYGATLALNTKCVRNNKRFVLVSHGPYLEVDNAVLPSHESSDSRAASFSQCFRDGLLTNIFNPKNALFYLAAFPQFIEQGTNEAASSFVLVIIHVIINALWYLLVALALDFALKKIGSQRLIGRLNSFTGYALICLAALFFVNATQLV